MVIKVLNIDKCIKKFEGISKVPMKAPTQKATQLVQKTAKLLSPVDTGYLRRSIRRKTDSKGNGAIGRVWTTTEYAIYQEFGTSKMKAHPFMRPALERNNKVIQEGFEKYINTYLSKYKK
jgi:HK97 gp10 family phage protein